MKFINKTYFLLGILLALGMVFQPQNLIAGGGCDFFLGVDDRTITSPRETQLTGPITSCDNQEYVSYQWDLGDGTSSASTNFTHTFAPGIWTISLTATTAEGRVDTDSIPIEVRDTNQAPVSVDDFVSAGGNVESSNNYTYVFPADNDTDPEGDLLSGIEVVDQPQNGTLEVFYTTLKYTPNPGFTGIETVTYQVRDEFEALSENVATVSFDVQPYNYPPELVTDYITLDERGSATVNLLANDTDFESDSLTIKYISSTPLGDNQYLYYTLNPDYTVTINDYSQITEPFTATAKYSVSDGTNTVEGTFYVTVNPVNRAPYPVDDRYSLDEDTSIEFRVLDNDYDADGDSLQVKSFSQTSNGELVSLGDGRFSYTPNPDFYGTDNFTYKAVDQFGLVSQEVANVYLYVKDVFDPIVPVEAVNDEFSLDEDTAVSGNVLSNDNYEANPLYSAVTLRPQYGKLQFSSNGDFTYTPNQDYFGADSFSYEVTDGAGNTSTASVKLTIFNVIEPSVAVNDNLGVDEDSQLNGNVLSNDIYEVKPLVELGVSVQNGTLQLDENGDFTYTPSSNYAGKDEFSYVLVDSSGNRSIGQVFITVNEVNDAPSGAFFTVSGSKFMRFTPSEASDLDGQVVSYTWNFGDGNSTTISSPIAVEHRYRGKSRTYIVTLTVTDNDGATTKYSREVSN